MGEVSSLEDTYRFVRHGKCMSRDDAMDSHSHMIVVCIC